MTPDLLATVSVFITVVLLFVGLALLNTQKSTRRPDLEAKKREDELMRYDAPRSAAATWRYGLLFALVVGGFLLFVAQNVVFALVAIIAGIVIPATYPGRIKKAYLLRFEEDFAECLDIWTRCLHSGLSFQQAVETASDDLSGPVAKEMKLLQSEMRLGDVDDALWRLHQRIPLPDVRYAVLGVITCRQTGGKMSEVMNNIGRAIRERMAMRNKINAITSMGRTEANILAAMPFLIGLVMHYLQPDAVSLLFTTVAGIVGTLVAILWETIGLVIIRMIVNVKT